MANTVFNNKIIEAKAKDLLTTAVNTRNLRLARIVKYILRETRIHLLRMKKIM